MQREEESGCSRGGRELSMERTILSVCLLAYPSLERILNILWYDAQCQDFDINCIRFQGVGEEDSGS